MLRTNIAWEAGGGLAFVSARQREVDRKVSKRMIISNQTDTSIYIPWTLNVVCEFGINSAPLTTELNTRCRYTGAVQSGF